MLVELQRENAYPESEMSREPDRPDPDVLLARIKRRSSQSAGGCAYTWARLRAWEDLRHAAGGHRRKERGTDVVAGLRGDTWPPAHAEQIGDLEVVPPREIPYKGVILREMDTDAVIRRHPKVALVDELAHTNVPGLEARKAVARTCEDLLDAGITVISTLNIQHIESLNDSSSR